MTAPVRTSLCAACRPARSTSSGLGPEAGAALASHPDINQLTFTGSVGRHPGREWRPTTSSWWPWSSGGGRTSYRRRDLDPPSPASPMRPSERRPDVLGGRGCWSSGRSTARSSGASQHVNAMRIGPRRAIPTRPDHLEEAARNHRAPRLVGQSEGARCGRRRAAVGPVAGTALLSADAPTASRRECAAQEEIRAQSWRSCCSTTSTRRSGLAPTGAWPRRRRLTRDINKAGGGRVGIKSGQSVTTHGAAGSRAAIRRLQEERRPQKGSSRWRANAGQERLRQASSEPCHADARRLRPGRAAKSSDANPAVQKQRFIESRSTGRPTSTDPAQLEARHPRQQVVGWRRRRSA